MAASFNLPPNVSVGAAVSAIQQAAKDLHLPASIATSFQGSEQAFQNSLSSTPILILAALIAVYFILGILYESTIHPIAIISTLPPAGLGALLTLMLFGMPLDVIGIIRIILLIGIVKKNGIVGGLLVSQLLTLFTTPVIYIYMDRFAASVLARPK